MLKTKFVISLKVNNFGFYIAPFVNIDHFAFCHSSLREVLISRAW
jgi:hypothetical protein